MYHTSGSEWSGIRPWAADDLKMTKRDESLNSPTSVHWPFQPAECAAFALFLFFLDVERPFPYDHRDTLCTLTSPPPGFITRLYTLNHGEQDFTSSVPARLIRPFQDTGHQDPEEFYVKQDRIGTIPSSFPLSEYSCTAQGRVLSEKSSKGASPSPSPPSYPILALKV